VDETIELPFDEKTDERYAQLLAARAAKSPDKKAKPVVMDLNKSF
jgi:hypothetical protein